MSDRPLSERVRVNMGADFDSDEWADEIATLEDEIKALCAHRDALEAERDRLLWQLDDWCVCEEGRRCRFCSAREG